MERIESWKINEVGSISEHLKECAYNVRNDHYHDGARSQAWADIIKRISKFDTWQGLKRNYQ